MQLDIMFVNNFYATLCTHPGNGLRLTEVCSSSLYDVVSRRCGGQLARRESACKDMIETAKGLAGQIINLFGLYAPVKERNPDYSGFFPAP